MAGGGGALPTLPTLLTTLPLSALSTPLASEYSFFQLLPSVSSSVHSSSSVNSSSPISESPIRLISLLPLASLGAPPPPCFPAASACVYRPYVMGLALIPAPFIIVKIATLTAHILVPLILPAAMSKERHIASSVTDRAVSMSRV